MSTENDTLPGHRRRSHDCLWRCLLLPLLVVNLASGFVIALWVPKAYPLLFVVGAFSLAYALHILSVCGILVGLEIHEGQKASSRIRDEIEYPIGTLGLLVLAGGLLIVLAGVLCALNDFLKDGAWVARLARIPVYVSGAVLIGCGVFRYVLTWRRRWVEDARKALEKSNTAEPGAAPNGSPATSVGKSGVREGPPSVS